MGFFFICDGYIHYHACEKIYITMLSWLSKCKNKTALNDLKLFFFYFIYLLCILNTGKITNGGYKRIVWQKFCLLFGCLKIFSKSKSSLTNYRSAVCLLILCWIFLAILKSITRHFGIWSMAGEANTMQCCQIRRKRIMPHTFLNCYLEMLFTK